MSETVIKQEKVEVFNNDISFNEDNVKQEPEFEICDGDNFDDEDEVDSTKSSQDPLQGKKTLVARNLFKYFTYFFR